MVASQTHMGSSGIMLHYDTGRHLCCEVLLCYIKDGAPATVAMDLQVDKGLYALPVFCSALRRAFWKARRTLILMLGTRKFPDWSLRAALQPLTSLPGSSNTCLMCVLHAVLSCLIWPGSQHDGSHTCPAGRCSWLLLRRDY